MLLLLLLLLVLGFSCAWSCCSAPCSRKTSAYVHPLMLEIKFRTVWNNRKKWQFYIYFIIFVFLANGTHKILTVIAGIPWIWYLYLSVHSI